MVLAGALYFVGLMQGRSQVSALETEVEQAEAEVAQMQARLAFAEDRSRMMNALALIYQTALDLDARNFGTANQRLQEAGTLLERVSTAAAEDREGFADLARDVKSTNLQVAANLRQQRALVFGFGQRLSALIPAEALPADPAPEAEDTEGAQEAASADDAAI